MSNDMMMQSIHEGGLSICGIAPRAILSTVDPKYPCFNCEGRVVRRFSGSGWYEDYLLCVDCGEDNASGYRPFEPGWRKKNMAKAQEWLDVAVDVEEFWKITGELVKMEMEGGGD